MTARNNNKSVKKGASKKVIDYDPLAWLDAADDEGDAEMPAAAASSSDDGFEETSASQPEQAPTEEESDDPGFGFFDDAPGLAGADEAGSPPGKDEAAHGFFDDDDSGEADADAAEESPGYGFFADEEGEDAGSAEAASEESAAYGFFDEEPPAGADTGPWKDEDGVIHLGPELVIRCIGQAHALIGETLSRGFDVRLDAGDLRKIDSAGLQMIYSLVMTLEKTGQSITWNRSSPLVDQRAAELGLPSLCGAETDDTDDAAFGFF